MKSARLNRLSASLAAALVVAACAAMGAEVTAPAAPEPGGTITTLADGKLRPNSEIYVHKVTTITDNGSAVNWSPITNRLVVAKRGVDRYFSVYSVSPDGLKRDPLTQSKQLGDWRLHNGDPSWHPSGEHIVFTSQNPGSPYQGALPGMGLNCNLWLADKAGSLFWQLTNITTSYTTPQGVVYPYFSPDGTRLVWAGNTGRYGNDFTWGERALYVADFRFEGGVPQLLNTKTLQPGQRKDFYESHGFAPDGNSVLFSANLGKEQPIYGMDICLMDVRTGTITMLTDTPTVWDEFASVSPDGKKVTWMTNAGQDVHFRAFGTTDWQRYLKSELWLMNADGSDPKQLTFFNSPGFPEHTGRRCFVGHNCWSNDGRNIAVCVHFETGSWQLEPKVLLLELGVGPAPDLVPQKLKPVEPAKPPMPLPDDRIRKPTTGGVPFRWGK